MSAVAAVGWVSVEVSAPFLPVPWKASFHAHVRLPIGFLRPRSAGRPSTLLVIIYLFFNGNLKAAIRDGWQASSSDTR